MSAADEPKPLPPLPEDAHKGRAGRALCFAGSRTMPGAAILVARAAQRAGAGLVTLVCRDANLLNVVPPASPETVLVALDDDWLLDGAGDLARWVDPRESHARLAGPGLGDDKRTARLIGKLLASEFAGPLVLDADALNALEEPEVLRDTAARVVITPHPGEAARLGVPVPDDADGRRNAARALAERTGAVVCLKGSGTVVTDGEREWVNATGNAGMATAGSGDVLAGMLVAYLARRVASGDPTGDPFETARLAAHVHGLAGDYAAALLGADALVASDLIAFLPQAQRRAAGEEPPAES